MLRASVASRQRVEGAAGRRAGRWCAPSWQAVGRAGSGSPAPGTATYSILVAGRHSARQVTERFRRVPCVSDLRRRLGRPLLVAVGRRFCFWLWVALLAIGPSAAVGQTRRPAAALHPNLGDGWGGFRYCRFGCYARPRGDKPSSSVSEFGFFWRVVIISNFGRWPGKHYIFSEPEQVVGVSGKRCKETLGK